MILAGAMILDAIIGDPKWLWSRIPHPVVLIGRFISKADKAWNSGRSVKAKGMLLIAILCLASIAIGLLPNIVEWGWIVELALAATLFAQRSLTNHVMDVVRALEKSLPQARAAVAMIVGRDTSSLDASGVARASIESAAENLSDGVVAPIFWFALAGLPGLILYKSINTADSMIGYMTPKHREFGFAAAKLDDLLNWIPARLTAAFIFLVSWTLPKWRGFISDASRHRSPNAGWPEAAMSRALSIALSGPRNYDGKTEDHPFVNPDARRTLFASDIRFSVAVLWRVWALLLAIAIASATVTLSAGSFL